MRSILDQDHDPTLPCTAGLLTVASLKENEFLEELFLVGNPCTKWPGYRTYVVGLLPRLKRLVGLSTDVKVFYAGSSLHFPMAAAGVMKRVHLVVVSISTETYLHTLSPS